MLGAAAVVAAGWAPPGVGGETAGRAADGRAEGVIDSGAGPCCAASGVPVRAAKPKPQAAAMVARLISISLPAPFLLEESRAGRLQSTRLVPFSFREMPVASAPGLGMGRGFLETSEMAKRRRRDGGQGMCPRAGERGHGPLWPPSGLVAAGDEAEAAERHRRGEQGRH